MRQANTFEAVADELIRKFEAEGDVPATLKKKRWLLDFANKEFGKRPIAEIKAPEILDAVRKIEKRRRKNFSLIGWEKAPLEYEYAAIVDILAEVDQCSS